MPPRKAAPPVKKEEEVEVEDHKEAAVVVVAPPKEEPKQEEEERKVVGAAAKRTRKPSKRAQESAEEDDEDEDEQYNESDDSDSDSEEYGGKKKKKTKTKKKAPAAKKRKATPPPAAGAGAAGAASPAPSPSPAAKKASPAKFTRQKLPAAETGREPKSREYEPATGYWLDPTLPLMWTAVSADGQVDGSGAVVVEPRSKVAAFDFDGTLVNPKPTGNPARQFALNADDWILFNDKVPKVVREYYNDGFEIVIISNQGGVKTKLAGKMAQKVKARVASVAATIGVPCRVLMCPSVEPCAFRKPGTGMWDFFETELRGPGAPKIDRAFSVYVGDAAGRPADHGKGADSDIRFAEAVGLPFMTPEQAFGEQKGKGPIAAEDWEAGKAALKAAKEGDDDEAGPNGALLAALQGVSDKIFALMKTKPECLPGEGDLTKWRFKAVAYRDAATSIAGGFRQKITLKNLTQVGKLPKVGKSTLDRLKECLESGRIKLMEELEGYEAAGSAPAAAVPAHVQQQQAAAAAFM